MSNQDTNPKYQKAGQEQAKKHAISTTNQTNPPRNIPNIERDKYQNPRRDIIFTLTSYLTVSSYMQHSY
jgi:hypothetical protein